MVHRFIALSLALACAATAQATDKTAAAKIDPAKGQQVAAQICAACHNPDGNSSVSARRARSAPSASDSSPAAANSRAIAATCASPA